MADVTGKVLGRQQLDNGVEIVLYDRSRVMAGDRWVIDLHCEACIPIYDSYWDTVAREDQQILAGIKKKLGNMLVQTFTKKRTFIAEEEREQLLQELVKQAHGGMLEYLRKPNFPIRLFEKRYRDARQQVITRQAMDLAENSRPGE